MNLFTWYYEIRRWCLAEEVYEEIRRHKSSRMPLKNIFLVRILLKLLLKNWKDFLTEVEETPITKVAEVNQERLEAVQGSF